MTSSEGWRHSGEWDPSAVDYELADASVTEHVSLVQSAKEEVKSIAEKLQVLDGAEQLGAETALETAENTKKRETLRVRLRDQELRAAYLEVKLKERLGAKK